MGLTRKRDLLAAIVGVAILACLLLRILYSYFPPITVWTGLSLLAVAAAEAVWGWSVRSRIRDGQIGVGGGRLHPLAVARSLVIAKASAWVGATVAGWWIGVLVYLLIIRTDHARADIPGVVVAAISAVALVIAALWLQNCCKSPGEPTDDPDRVAE